VEPPGQTGPLEQLHLDLELRCSVEGGVHSALQQTRKKKQCRDYDLEFSGKLLGGSPGGGRLGKLDFQRGKPINPCKLD